MCSIQFSPAGLLAGGGSAITDKNRSDDATEEARLVVSTSPKRVWLWCSDRDMERSGSVTSRPSRNYVMTYGQQNNNQQKDGHKCS